MYRSESGVLGDAVGAVMKVLVWRETRKLRKELGYLGRGGGAEGRIGVPGACCPEGGGDEA